MGGKSTLNDIYRVLRAAGRGRNLAFVLAVASVVSVIATYFAVTRSESPLGPDPRSVLGFLLTDLILLLALAGVISKRLVRLVVERRRGLEGSRLQTRIVVMFSLVAIVPTITMAFFSLMFFNFGIQSWFNERVSTALDGSVKIAQSYLEENKKIIRADIMEMANDLNREAYNIRKDPRTFSLKLALLAGLRKLPEAIVFQKNHDRIAILARTNLSFSLQMIMEDLSDNLIEQAAQGQLVTLTSDSDDRVIALARLDSFFDTYLLVGRFVDTKIINHIELTTGAANEYKSLRNNLSGLQIKFFIVFVIVSLLLLLATVWFGILFATSLVRPISSLVTATAKVKEGDLSVRVKEGPVDDEIATLARSFNLMAKQLERQRKELISAQRRSAWSDVARRIAHEIKNPLTPIQLAADRLKRKYSDQVEDRATFLRYINTIIRNVADIGKMVDEFANFARIPAPVFANYDMAQIVRDVVFSREDGARNIVFDKDIPEKSAMVICDESQMVRIFTNLLKNAEEALEDATSATQSRIEIQLCEIAGRCVVYIRDNGKGFPENIQDRLTEPYVTTKSKGTGLGLAIVKKIVEDHNGTLEFYNVESGACVEVSFALANEQKDKQVQV